MHIYMYLADQVLNHVKIYEQCYFFFPEQIIRSLTQDATLGHDISLL